MTSQKTETSKKPFEGVAAELVVHHIRELIERGDLTPGARLPAERELALRVGVSRPSVRAGLRALAAMGVVQSRHGAGTFIRGGPPSLGSEPLSFLAALHGFTRDEMFEARRVLEVGVAGLAAEPAPTATSSRRSRKRSPACTRRWTTRRRSWSTTSASIARWPLPSGNPILASLVEMVSEIFYEHRRKTASHGSDLKEAADLHRAIYHALRSHDADRARRAMEAHLVAGPRPSGQRSRLRWRRPRPSRSRRPCCRGRMTPAPQPPAVSTRRVERARTFPPETARFTRRVP